MKRTGWWPSRVTASSRPPRSSWGHLQTPPGDGAAALHPGAAEAGRLRYEIASTDLCAVIDERSDTLERMVAGVGSERILFGTDMPWFDYHYYLAGVLTAAISEDAMRDILYRNALRLFGLGNTAP